MKATVLYRMASILLFVPAAGNTYGVVRFWQAAGARGWTLFAYQLLGVYVSLNVLSGPVRILSVALAICTGWAGWAAWLSRGVHSESPAVK